ncbi:hypothetical protein C0991_011599 [Blastosporella zonata]|nr:hypothetical protein C0991_011599 [Blastosporella zonata]
MAFNTLSAGRDVALSYIDSGEPSSTSAYTTIIAFHGLCYTNNIFQKLLPLARNKGSRFVALNRRNYPGSTPFSDEELALVLNGGGDAKKEAVHHARGLEFATFIDNFISKNNIHPISEDGKSGGIVLLGWSFGCTFALAAISSACALPVDVRARLGAHIRAVIAYDPFGIGLGLPTPPQKWNPLLDPHIPDAHRLALFNLWVGGYFDHGDISKRDADGLSWVYPSLDHIPTAFRMSLAQREDVTCFGEVGFSDLQYAVHFTEQFKASYSKVAYDPETLKIFPALKSLALFGEMSGGFAITCLWAIEDELKEKGASALKVKSIPGWHWDDPEKALEEFLA